MTRIKFCGITRAEDARAAVHVGASAIGVVFWPNSPRCVDWETAKGIVSALPAGVPAIGVFVNQSVADINDTIAAVGLFGVQLHGDEPLDIISRIRRPVVRAMTLERAAGIGAVPAHVTVLLDAHDPVRRGGTGTPVNWVAAREVARLRPVVLAGGLTPENVAEAIAIVRPYAVDVSSGVERAPGIKDHDRMAAFAAAVARADAQEAGTDA